MQQVRPKPAGNTRVANSARWRILASKMSSLRVPIGLLLVVVIVTLGQFVEDSLDTPKLEMLTPSISIPRWALPVLTLYILLVLQLIQRTAARIMPQVRQTVQCDDKTFQEFYQRMARLPLSIEIGLAMISVLFVIVLFPILHSPLPIVRNPGTNQLTYLPTDPLNAFVVLAAYSLVGWAALTLVVDTLRLGSTLGELTRRPLAFNVYDITNVLPFGRLALVLSAAPAGVILILLVGLGAPTGALAWFAFALASLASVLALVLPLRGVHSQMNRAKKSALAALNNELNQIQREMLDANSPDITRTGQLSNRTNILVNLRKVVQEGPTWPFIDSAAVSRAALIATAPLIYAVLNELIRIFLITPLTK